MNDPLKDLPAKIRALQPCIPEMSPQAAYSLACQDAAQLAEQAVLAASARIAELERLYRDCRKSLWSHDAQDPEIFDAETESNIARAQASTHSETAKPE